MQAKHCITAPRSTCYLLQLTNQQDKTVNYVDMRVKQIREAASMESYERAKARKAGTPHMTVATKRFLIAAIKRSYEKHCPQGHKYLISTIRVKDRAIVCRTCQEKPARSSQKDLSHKSHE